MWYGSFVRRHGRSRPYVRYQARRCRLKRRRSPVDGSEEVGINLYNFRVKIYTKTGDAGETSLFDNTRVSKSDARVDAYGEVDELNACLGLVRAAGPDQDIAELMEALQKDLFALGARLADPSARIAARVTKAVVSESDVSRLEQAIDRLELELPPVRRFILPGGSQRGALLHFARTICRRAERRVIGLGPNAVEPIVIVYLNRLSDLLFVMARAVNHRAGAHELEW